jgi:hypothetical protein
MGFNPILWGSQAWHFIHFVAISYPENPTKQDKVKYNKFFQSIGDVLPCPTCGKNFQEKIKKYPPNLESRQKLFEWTVDIHNAVNAENGKKIISYETAFEEIWVNSKDDYFTKALVLSFTITATIILASYILSKKTLTLPQK